MAVFDLSMQGFLVPGLRNYQPKVGKMKDLGVSLTTLEVVNNMATPYTRVFTLTDGDLVTGPVEADCTVIYRTDGPQQLDFTALKGSAGVRVTVIHEGSGSLEVVLTSGLSSTTAKVEPTSPVMFLYPKYSGGVQVGWLASQGGVSTDATSGGDLTRRFTHEVSDSEHLKLMITQPDTFFAGHTGKDVSVVVRSGDYKLVKPYKERWDWFNTNKLGQVIVVCEDNVNISLTYDFEGFNSVDDSAGSVESEVAYFIYGYDSRVDWHGGRFCHYILDADFVMGSQSTGGGGSPVSYTPFGTLSNNHNSVVSLFGNRLPVVQGGSYKYQFFGSDFYQVTPESTRIGFCLVLDVSMASNSIVPGYYWRLVFNCCRVYQLNHNELPPQLLSTRTDNGTIGLPQYFPLFSNLGGDSAYPNSTAFGGPAFVGGEFLSSTEAGNSPSTFGYASQTWGILSSNSCTFTKVQLASVLEKVKALFPELSVIEADAIWLYEWDSFNSAFSDDVYPPLKGSIQLTNINLSGNQYLSLIKKLMGYLTKGSY